MDLAGDDSRFYNFKIHECLQMIRNCLQTFPKVAGVAHISAVRKMAGQNNFQHAQNLGWPKAEHHASPPCVCLVTSMKGMASKNNLQLYSTMDKLWCLGGLCAALTHCSLTPRISWYKGINYPYFTPVYLFLTNFHHNSWYRVQYINRTLWAVYIMIK